MVVGVIYLDIDDEITSAASRIRSVDGRRVAVVLPYGSRVATSRINFRLLARDAITHEKRLSVVAGDAATRALAASAGLPVFASVQEYEEAIEAEGTPEEVEATVTLVGPPDDAAPRVGAAGAPSAPTAPGPKGPRPDGPAAADADADLDATAAHALAGATTRTRPATGSADPGPAPRGGARPRDDEPRVRPATGRRGPAAVGGGLSVPRTPLLIATLLTALVVIVGGVGAYLLLPAAEITLAPREQAIGPLAFRVDASTDLAAPDIESGLVPALTVPVDVAVGDSFPATGERVEETAATGAVRFDNLDPTTSNTIAKGAIVSTNGGIRFRTDRSITIPAAKLVGFTIVPARASVAITAVDPGTEGNVQPNAITTVPRGEEPLFLKVTNPEETTGGTSETFPRVTQEDVDAAVAALTTAMQTDFEARLDDADLAPREVTVFAETATLGEPVWSLDPETIVGQEIETFMLGASAKGSVLAVDTAPLEAIAAARLAAAISSGYRLVEGSSDISVEPAVVDGAAITFPVKASAREVRILDATAIAAEIRGLPVADAQAVLDSYGTGTITLWPDWVTTIPTLDGRVTLVISEPES